jgi:long-chain acyl-CoA synthetase
MSTPPSPSEVRYDGEYYPSGITWDMPLRKETLVEVFDRSVERFRHRPCTHFLGQGMSFGDMGALTEQIAGGLARLGVGPTVHVGLVLPNTPYFIACFYAILKLGGTVVSFNPLYTVDELAHQARNAEVNILITVDIASVFEKVAALVDQGVIEKVVVCPFADILPPVKKLLFNLFKRSEVATVPDHGAFIDLETLLEGAGDYERPDIHPEDVAVLQYTGGTTGTPKGAMLTHANLTINLQQVRAWFTDVVDGQERMMGVLPFFHVFALTGVMNLSIAHGFEIILMPRFKLEDTLKLIRAHRVTLFPGVPTIFGAIINSKSARPEALSSLKYAISGGAPLPLEIRKGFEAMTGCSLVEGYGLSETSPVVTINPFSGRRPDNSIGLPVPGTLTSIRSLDDPSQPVPLGEKGELCVAGPQVMKGYWKQPEETARVFIGNYLRTGDVGYADRDGFIYLVDRIKDIIIASGFNIYPRRIEDAIHAHPAVAECTVIGIKDDYRGEAPKAFVKLRPGARLTVEELLHHLEPRLSKIEMPAEIEFRDELPKTMIGKLSKKALREET